MAEAALSKDANANTTDVTAPEALSSGEVIQLPNGQAGATAALAGIASGDPAALQTAGQFTLTKTTGLVILDGGKVYWDRSANSATPLQAAAGADFYAGVAVGDALSADTTVVVDLNVLPNYTIDMFRDAGDTVVVLSAGTPFAINRGGALDMGFSLTAEAQKLDWLSKHSIPVTENMIVEAIFTLTTVSDADSADFNIGLANATHASNAETITESVLFQHNVGGTGAELSLNAHSEDGTTTVALTDTTVDVVVGTPVEVWIDARDLTDIQLYVDGVNVLPASVFKLGDATGPMKLLAHLEKSSDDTPGACQVSHLAVRTPDVN